MLIELEVMMSKHMKQHWQDEGDGDGEDDDYDNGENDDGDGEDNDHHGVDDGDGDMEWVSRSDCWTGTMENCSMSRGVEQRMARFGSGTCWRRDVSNERNTSKNEKIFYHKRTRLKPESATRLVSSPDPDSQQLRVDYITATFPRSGDVIHPQGIWVWGRDYYKADPEKKKASVRDTYKADPEKKKASVRDTYKADPEKKKASVRDTYNANAVSKRAAKRQRYQEGVEENRAAKRQRYQEGVEENRAAKRQRYQEGVEENRAANRRIYRGNSATIKAARRSRYWYWKGRRTTTTTQRYTAKLQFLTQNVYNMIQI
ncbi:hypothetical protein EMCRGX_G004972 [Ephydatia muelleri]